MLFFMHTKIGMVQDPLVSCQGGIKDAFNPGLGYSQWHVMHGTLTLLTATRC